MEENKKKDMIYEKETLDFFTQIKDLLSPYCLNEEILQSNLICMKLIKELDKMTEEVAGMPDEK